MTERTYEVGTRVVVTGLPATEDTPLIGLHGEVIAYDDTHDGDGSIFHVVHLDAPIPEGFDQTLLTFDSELEVETT